MRFIVLRSSVTTEGQLVIEGLSALTQKPSGVVHAWSNLSTSVTNCFEPKKCDLLSFEHKDQLERDLELWDLSAENVAIIGVDLEEIVKFNEP
jgi:hypothetical protein